MDEYLTYYVSHPGENITVIQGGGCYILINGTVPGWNAGTLIEPFNTIFEPLPGNGTVMLQDDNRAYDLSQIVLTNTPTVSGAQITPGYSFQLAANTLTMDKIESVPTRENDGILSVNGVTPVDGNLTLKVLP